MMNQMQNLAAVDYLREVFPNVEFKSHCVEVYEQAAELHEQW